MPPSTDRSASRLCGGVRSPDGTESAIGENLAGRGAAESLPAETRRGAWPLLGADTSVSCTRRGELVGLDDEHLDLRRHLAVEPHGHGVLAQRANRIGQLDLALV